MTARRLPTSARVALLAIAMVLASNLAIIAFLRWHTQDEAVAVLRERVVEQARTLDDVADTAGRPALASAVRALAGAGDGQLFAALLDGSGEILTGNARPLEGVALRPGFQVDRLDPRGARAPVDAAFVARRIGDGWLISGRALGEGIAVQRTFERSLLLALALSMLFGLGGGLVVARYVAHRVGAIADVVDEVGEGDLGRRVAEVGGGDSFDRLARRINRMLDRITGLMEELRLLTDSLAHDLRSPVGRLRARVERALTTTDEAQRDAMLGGVMQEADGLMRILATVLEIGRVEAMARRRNFSWVDPAGLIAELAEMYEPLAEEAGVALTARVDGRPPAFEAHRQLLAQCLSNLVDNALNYGAGGGGIELFAEAHDGGLRLGVADRGPGIAPADLAEARRRFGRLDSSRSAPGAGLGLALVEAVARLHGGSLDLADNAPGLRATLVLPARG